jgi:isobutyryl-CoA mutase
LRPDIWGRRRLGDFIGTEPAEELGMTRIKIITAAALFDGHDVSINIFSKLMHKRGAEVVHLGHNRSVDEILHAAIQEDADAILVSSYQGGHNEYFRYLIDSLRKHSADNILVFGGGGGVILPAEIAALEAYGVTRIYHASEGQTLGIHGIADDIVARIVNAKETGEAAAHPLPNEEDLSHAGPCDERMIARQLSHIERSVSHAEDVSALRALYQQHDKKKTTVIGVTGTGGSGKSSLIDELIIRLLNASKQIQIGVLAVDPSRKQSGGAFLGDRIRYNSIDDARVYFRSFATRGSESELSLAIYDSIDVLRAHGFDIVIVETSGIGQGDSRITTVSDISVYVMTAEYGAPTQLEKIDMLDMADLIVINKFDKIGSEDAFRHVALNYTKNRNIRLPRSTELMDANLPIFPVMSNQFNNRGVNKLFSALVQMIPEPRRAAYGFDPGGLQAGSGVSDRDFSLIDHRRLHYLAEIVDIVKQYHTAGEEQAMRAGICQALKKSRAMFDEGTPTAAQLEEKFSDEWNDLSTDVRTFLEGWDERVQGASSETFSYTIQNQEHTLALTSTTLSQLEIPRVALPKYTSWEELVKFYCKENLPGQFPFTAGVFPFKSPAEAPRRQFAGEGGPERTNARFHYLSRNDTARRLSTAFDGITLYGEDPAVTPDIYGKIGESGVNICTIDDMDALFDGFDLQDPSTSVSMTINAPAPIMLAMYFMTAYRRELNKKEQCGISLDAPAREQLKRETFRNLRGTVQADILKEDQAQNTCIFSINFAMKLLGDVQEYFARNAITKYYTLSISGYHIAEAGANPITQLAFTLANGFTYVEYFLHRGIALEEFAPNLSFFFSNGMEPEYSVIGRVARRIWAIAMKYKYHGSEKTQKLKYHIQTSGRSLHAREIDFNDIRTTLQALLAYYDNCNSLHTNSYDEAITTPTEESVRRSMAIQLILAKEFGMIKNENPNQGSFIIEELTDLVEEAVLDEFERLSRRGGVLGAMETQYQRSKIQEESLHFEELKQSGEYPIVGVNTFIGAEDADRYKTMTITRTTKEEKDERLGRLEDFHHLHRDEAQAALGKLHDAALNGKNLFEELLNTVQYASLGQITNVLYRVGGKYRRGF